MSDHLFAEMDAIADALRANDPTLRESLSDELQLEFRQLQKRRMPPLGRDQFLDLFTFGPTATSQGSRPSWPSCASAGRGNYCKLTVVVAERNANNPHLNQFLCKCGELIADPLDPEQMKIHQPHFIADSLPQVDEALTRWLDHARRTASDLGGEA
jgi:hypothetical protein